MPLLSFLNDLFFVSALKNQFFAGIRHPLAMECSANSIQILDSPYQLFLRAFSLIPISHYVAGFSFLFFVFIYNFLEFHFFQDFFTGFRGQPVNLTFNSCSELYHEVASKCHLLHSRYLATPWLSSPHFQTTFLNFFAWAPTFKYKRQLFYTSDGGTIALDWLMRADVMDWPSQVNDEVQKDDRNPIVIVIPGLTSDSDSTYIKHLVFWIATHGFNVVVSNHRGLGGISITSDCVYNAGWTEDTRKIINHLHHQYPEAPLFAVGTSIGANILVKFLGEDGVNIPIVGAAAISSPWDLLIGDRFINRKLVQKFYDKALAIGLKGYAQLHKPMFSRLANWEGIRKSRSIRDFDNYATCLVGKFETVDTYYRRCCSAELVGNIMVPLLCINSLDDPLCTSEAIPWDECRANKNVILATTHHGGHLACFEGIMAKSLWWVRAVEQFISILSTSPLIYKKNEIQTCASGHQAPSIDQGPYINVVKDGMVAAVCNDPTVDVVNHIIQNDNIENEAITGAAGMEVSKNGNADTTEAVDKPLEAAIDHIVFPVKKCIDQLSRYSRKSIWLLGYIAIITTWPLVGSALRLFYKKKKNQENFLRRTR